jgi:hypothetical protein
MNDMSTRNSSENISNLIKARSQSDMLIRGPESDKMSFSEFEAQEDIEQLIISLNSNLIEFIKSQRGSR